MTDVDNIIDTEGHIFWKKTFTTGSNKWSERTRTITGSLAMSGLVHHLDTKRLELYPEGLRNIDNLIITFKSTGSLYNNDILEFEGDDYLVKGRKPIHRAGVEWGYKAFLVKNYDFE